MRSASKSRILEPSPQGLISSVKYKQPLISVINCNHFFGSPSFQRQGQNSLQELSMYFFVGLKTPKFTFEFNWRAPLSSMNMMIILQLYMAIKRYKNKMRLQKCMECALSQRVFNPHKISLRNCGSTWAFLPFRCTFMYYFSYKIDL